MSRMTYDDYERGRDGWGYRAGRYRDDWDAPPTSSEADRTVALVAYVLHLVGAVAGFTSIIAVVLNYLKRNQSGALLDSHHRWMIRSFWWALLWLVVGIVTSVILIGFVIGALAWLWFVYRQVRGLIGLANGLPMPG